MRVMNMPVKIVPMSSPSFSPSKNLKQNQKSIVLSVKVITWRKRSLDL